jgi:hypothetical protein
VRRSSELGDELNGDPVAQHLNAICSEMPANHK